jgi:hypothetical protein
MSPNRNAFRLPFHFIRKLLEGTLRSVLGDASISVEELLAAL